MRRSAALGLLFSMAACALVGAAQPATVRVWNWNIHDKKYQQKMYKQFNAAHPDIKIEYSSISNTVYAQTLEAAFVAKDPPDLFLPVGKYAYNYLRTQGLIKPLNECAPNDAALKNWMAQFPAVLHRFQEGVSSFGGKVYNVDTSGEATIGGHELFYNLTLFRQAGIEKPPATQSQLRQTAAKVTQAGQGKSFGITHGLRYAGAWSQDYGALVWAAGVKAYSSESGLDPRDGRPHWDDPLLYDAMKTWIGMRVDGSVYPGETVMEDEAAKMAFATDKASMFFGGSWVPGNVLAYNADADFDVMLPPTPEDGVFRGYTYTGGKEAPGGYVVSAFTKNPNAVWEVIKFISSAEYQTGYVQGGYGISYLPEASKPENYTVKQMYKFAQWGMDPALKRLGPVLSDDARKVFSYLPGLYPPIEDVLNNVYLGTLGFDALVDLDKRYEERFDAGIKKAQEAGIKVTRSDFIFPDWDPTKDYVTRPRP